MDDITNRITKTPPSCVECRRRKSKCDRLQPCSNCTRYGHLCSYEKVSRTPLTRKHLTDVEKELARTKALLRRYETIGISSAPRGIDVAEEQDNSQQALARPSTSTAIMLPQTPRPELVSTNSFETGRAHTITSSTETYQEDFRSTSILPRMSNANGVAEVSPTFSLETPPATGDFDWDERVSKSSTSRFIDGMASLTERSSRGYMGVASGAALLRLADDTSGASGIEMDSHDQDEAMHSSTPVPVALFTPSQLEPFVDAYFQTYHISYPIIHEATFKAQFMEVIPRPKGNAWQVLLHIVAALGSFAGSENAPNVDVALFEAAKARVSIDILETGNLVLVQALTLISNYVQKRNKPNSGYNYLGLARRVAMGIGLHKEFPTWRSKPLMLETRRRVWWCLYIFDAGATITFSRPLDMPKDGIEVELPLNVSDSEITASTQKFPQELHSTTLYTHVRCQSKFHLATSEIYSRLISTHFPPAEEMVRLDDFHLAKWISDLPPFFREGAVQAPKFRLSHAILQWRWRNFRILMYRPFLMRRFITRSRGIQHHNQVDAINPSEEAAIKRCLEAAAETVHLITNYWRQRKQNVMACWYSLYFLFQAILIPVICLRNDPHSSLAGGWRDQVLSALEAISDMARLNAAASRCHMVIMNLCGAYLDKDMGQWDSPTHESPQTQLNALYSFMWPMTDPQFPGGYDLAPQESAIYDFMNQIVGP